jgi:hypothetical protein
MRHRPSLSLLISLLLPSSPFFFVPFSCTPRHNLFSFIACFLTPSSLLFHSLTLVLYSSLLLLIPCFPPHSLADVSFLPLFDSFPTSYPLPLAPSPPSSPFTLLHSPSPPFSLPFSPLLAPLHPPHSPPHHPHLNSPAPCTPQTLPCVGPA